MKWIIGLLLMMTTGLVLGATVRLAWANETTPPLIPFTLVKGTTESAEANEEPKRSLMPRAKSATVQAEEEPAEEVSEPVEEADSLERASEITDNREEDLDAAKAKIGQIGKSK